MMLRENLLKKGQGGGWHKYQQDLLLLGSKCGVLGNSTACGQDLLPKRDAGF